ncbi:YciI family protein [Asanoa ishikariensis]|nr:YciI family protein [Asanoa ishikariensis]
MRFLMTLNAPVRPPDQELFAEMGKFVDDLAQAGVLIATGGLAMEGTHVSSSGGKVTVVDGPYPETKETIVSFALVEVASKDEAVALSQRFFGIVGDGEGDLRQVFGPE